MNKSFWVSDPRAKGGGFFAEQLETTPRQKKSEARRQEEFAKVPLQWAAEMAEAAKTPGAMVWILLRYMAWKAKDQTFPLSSALLKRYGIARETKRRVLARLEAAGLIEIQRRHRQAPIITLLR